MTKKVTTKRKPGEKSATGQKPTKAGKNAAATKKAAPKKETKKSSQPKVFEQYSICSVIRWCGANGYDKEQAGKALKELTGTAPADGTLTIQIRSGNGGSIPELTKKEQAAIKRAAK